MLGFRNFFIRSSQLFAGLGSRGVLISVSILALVGCIIIPLDTFMLDVLLVVNIVIALIVLLRGLSLNDPAKLFSFPTILLFATLFRLALNVSSTRLILLDGVDKKKEAAGTVIGSFGDYVVKGDPKVGAIIFLVIAVVNLIVIAKGSARVAEVAARFVLDSMPGKQLAIDAELRTGGISQETALQRREDLNRESQFFGAMDGAMKFVQGDAVAGLFIVVVNLIGGLIIGLTHKTKAMTLDGAFDVFGTLAIGDGLVNIIPSLLMSLSAGIIVTHVAGRSGRGSAGEMFAQLVGDPSAIFMAAAALFVAALFPAMPFIPFALVSLVLLAVAFGMKNVTAQQMIPSIGSLTLLDDSPRAAALNAPASKAGLTWSGSASTADESAVEGSETDLLTLEVDARFWNSVIGATSSEKNEQFKKNFSILADRVQRERGIVLPRLSILERDFVSPGEYRINVREQRVRAGRIPVAQVMLTTSAASLPLFGIENGFAARHPLDSRSAVWVGARNPGLKAAERLGIEIIDAEQFLLYEIIGASMQVVEEIFGLDEVKLVTQQLRERHKLLVDEIFEKNILSYAELTEVLRRLVRERVNIRDLKLILEGISEFASMHSAEEDDRQRWISDLHAFLRIVLHRTIMREALGTGEKLRVFVLSNEVEEEFRSVLSVWDGRRSNPPLDPEIERSLKENARKMFHPVVERGNLPVVLLCADDIRQAVQEFFHRQLSAGEWIRAVAYQELDGGYKPESVGVLGI